MGMFFQVCTNPLSIIRVKLPYLLTFLFVFDLCWCDGCFLSVQVFHGSSDSGNEIIDSVTSSGESVLPCLSWLQSAHHGWRWTSRVRVWGAVCLETVMFHLVPTQERNIDLKTYIVMLDIFTGFRYSIMYRHITVLLIQVNSLWRYIYLFDNKLIICI